MKIRRNNLTLIELLVVIGIATLLITIVTPSFRKMMTGNAVDQAASQLKLGLEKAQSYAISSHRYVALILPQGGKSTWSTDEEKNSILGGYRIAYVKRTKSDGTPNSTWKFDSWVPTEQWIGNNKNARLIKIVTDKDDTEVGEKGLPNCPEKSNVFLRSSDASTNHPLKNIEEYPGSVPKEQVAAIIFSSMGGLMETSVDSYFVLAEAVENDGDLFYPNGGNGGKNPFNIKVIKVNHLTGAMEFIE